MNARIGLITLSALFSAGAIAGAMGSASFSELDRDDDGVISKQEAQGTPLGQSFQQADQDKDKNVSKSEFSMFEQQQQMKQSGGGKSSGSSSGGGQSSGGSQ